MPVVALTERGLIIDVFGPDPLIIKCQEYKASGNCLVSVLGKTASFINLSDPTDSVKTAISGYVDMKMSKDGSKVVILEYGKKITVFDNRAQVATFDDVEEFSVSDSTCAFSAADTLYLYGFATNAVLFQTRLPVKALYCVGSGALVITRKEKSQRILLVEDGAFHQVLELENIYGTTVEVSEDGSRCLVSVEVEYAKNSYYADSVLYLLVFHGKTSQQDGGMPGNCSLSSGEKQGPLLVTSDELFSLYSYSTLKKVTCFKFLGNSFYVCFGNQPSCLHLYSPEGYFLRSYRRVVRNKAHFSRDGSRIINAGLGNLPGNVEVFCDDVSTCKFESLGASIVEWLNDDTHFMVATTNYFKSDNQIKIFDYYGREVEVMECENLVRASVYGETEGRKTLAAPRGKTVSDTSAGYIPPHMRSNKPAGAITGDRKIALTSKRQSGLKDASPQRSKAEIEKELNECMHLKKRLAEGEELSLSDQNRVFRISHLQDELTKYK